MGRAGSSLTEPYRASAALHVGASQALDLLYHGQRKDNEDRGRQERMISWIIHVNEQVLDLQWNRGWEDGEGSPC
jgi:hypothetical protein